ncbi:hypothetical protein BsWGS_21375 [Bradybaena similaris]
MLGFLLIALGAITGALSDGELAIPRRELGFVHGNGKSDALVKVAAYLDLTCDGSKDAFSTLQEVDDHYTASQLQLKFHLFSLPHHRHSHTISKAAHHLNYYTNPKGAKLFKWFKIVYNNIGSLRTADTVNQTDIEVLNFLASLAYNVTGISSADFKAGVADIFCETAARLDNRYAITRGVWDAPWFFVNDVRVTATYKWNFTQWTNLIDPLLSP